MLQIISITTSSSGGCCKTNFRSRQCLLMGACLLLATASVIQTSLGQLTSQANTIKSPHIQASPSPPATHQKCTKQSIILARQMLAYELDKINSYSAFWFTDLDKDELIEEQKQSLSSMVMSGSGRKLLNSNGQPLFEIESSYFKPALIDSPLTERGFASNKFTQRNFTTSSSSSSSNENINKQINIKLIRRHADRCTLNSEKHYYNYAFALSLGPFEHHLDVVYNLPKDLSLSQPIEWRYGQIKLLVPRMNYEIILKQSVDLVDYLHIVNGTRSSPASNVFLPIRRSLPLVCPPIELREVTFVPSSTQQNSLEIHSRGLDVNNRTKLQMQRIFDDYTRPTISQRLKQMLRFYLSNKTLPLSVVNVS